MDTGSYMANQMDNEITASLMEKDIFDGNEAIAEFDGWKFETIELDCISGSYKGDLRWKVSLSELKHLMVDGFRFHSKWDKLMPIVEKIHQLAIAPDAINKITDNRIFNFSIMAPMQDVWKAVIEFIIWYNKQQENYIDTSEWINGVPPNF